MLNPSRYVLIAATLVCAIMAAATSGNAQEVASSEEPPDFSLGLMSPIGAGYFASSGSAGPNYGTTLNGPDPTLAIGDNLNFAFPARIPFHVVASLSAGYDDNVNSGGSNNSSGGGGSAFASTNLGLSYDFGTPRTRLAVQANGGVTYYSEQKTEDYNASLGLRLTHKFSPRLNFEADTFFTYTAQPTYNSNLGINREIGSYIYSSDQAIVSYLWTPRFSTISSYTFSAFFHEGQNAPATNGNDLSNIGSSDDRVQNTFSNRFRYLLLPTSAVVAEYRLGFINYQTTTSFDSTTNSLLLGFEQTFTRRLTASFRAGVEYRSYSTQADSLAPTFEGSLNYLLGERSSLNVFINYALQPADVAGQAERTNFILGVNGSYRWTARITSSLSLTYGHDDYGGAGTSTSATVFSENTFNASLSARYAVTRYFGVNASYNFTDVISDTADRSYSRNHVFLGVDFAF